MEKQVGERSEPAVSIWLISDVVFIWDALWPAGYFHLAVRYKMKRFITCTRELNFPVWKVVRKLQDYLC
jgi:hypothetical protein